MNTPTSISKALKSGYRIKEVVPGNPNTIFLEQRFKGSRNSRAQKDIFFRICDKALTSLKNKGEIPE